MNRIGFGAIAFALGTSTALAQETVSRVGANMDLLVGKSTLLRLPDAIDRVAVGDPKIADVNVITQRELYLLGKDIGTTNVIVWAKGGGATIIDIKVTVDPVLLQNELRLFMPDEKDIQVKPSADSIVLTGTVSDAAKAERVVELAEAWIRRLTRGTVLPITMPGAAAGGTTISMGGGQNLQTAARVAGPGVVNMLRIRAPQQVMLEVKVAEVSKSLLNKLGVSLASRNQWLGSQVSIGSSSNFFNELLGIAQVVRNGKFGQIDAQRDDGLVNVLAEPTIMAISGQEASFLAGGKIFVPVARENSATGGVTITLEEKKFGVGVEFRPTVLEGGRINLRVASQVSEIQKTGTPFTTINGVTSVFPSFTVRTADTTVQLMDGQSFMIAGLVKNNVTETISRFPVLGDLPVLGALFRSSEFQRDKTELMFVITPRLVKPLPEKHALPTDRFVEPTPEEFFLEGRLEGRAGGDRSGGFDVK